MASLPSLNLSTSIPHEPELRKYSSPSLPASEKSTGLPFQRSSVDTKLDGSFEPIRPLEFREALSSIKEGANVDSSHYVPLLQECIDKNSLLETEIIHAHMIKNNAHEEVFLMIFLVNVYAKCGDMTSAQRVFDHLPRRNVVAWTTLMTGYAQNSEPLLAVEVFQRMLEAGSLPSNVTLGIALNACASLESIELGKQFHAFIIKYKIDFDCSIGNALCSLYSKFGSLKSAVRAFQGIEEKNVISWTAVISACNGNGDAAMGLRFFIEMLNEDVQPNGFTFTSVLSLCCVMLHLSVGAQVHALVIKFGYESNLRVTNSVLYLYLKCGRIDEAQRLFNRMKDVNLVTWNAMIAGHAQATDIAKDNLSAQHSGTEALSIYLKLNRSGMKPDLFTLSSILTVCGKMVALDQGEQVHAQCIKSGFLADVVVGTALVTMYNKCGSINRASKAFLEMSIRTLISWTTMIASLAQSGHSQRALQLFEDMLISGIRPNQITFVGVLSACGQAGLVNEALGYFEMMQKDYKLKPVRDHYSCLIDMYLRLGRLEDAFGVVKRMNSEPCESIWSHLVAGCRRHGNKQLGLYAAEKLLKLRPQDIETYMTLLNMYQSAEKWDDVSRVKSLMEEEGIGMLQDWSQINIRENVHSFRTDEHLDDPFSRAEVYKHLDELLNEAKRLGYNTDESIEVEEEKITLSSAVYHSEKLAVAFGLLNTHSISTIRVIKYITMCRDCHNFMKIVSSLTSRKITIRDSKRLHIFVDGQCSCADSVSLTVE